MLKTTVWTTLGSSLAAVEGAAVNHGHREYTSCTVYENDNQRSYRLLATLAGYLVVSLTLITTARRSPLERFGLNVSCS